MGLFTRTKNFFRTKKTFQANEMFMTHLRNRVGEGIALNIDGSTVPQIFEWIVPAGKNAWIKRLNLAGVNAGIEMSNFCGVTELANGMVARVVDSDDNLIQDFTADHTVKNTLTLAAFNGDNIGSTIDRLGSLEDSFLFSNDFKANTGEELFMREGWKFQLIINDDLTGITIFGALVKGIAVNKF